MNVTVYCLDYDDALERRLAHYEAHKAYLSTAPIKTLISGPLTKPDGITMIGSFFLYEADSLEAVTRFLQDDPFNQANVWASIDVRPFIKRVDNR
jgi:uncharacterized protein YciI